MIKKLAAGFLLIFLFACTENDFENTEPIPLLSLEQIKREYFIADSLNLLHDRSHLNFETVILGIDKRNNQTIIRTPVNRGFGCLMYPDFFTILYLNCDSVCCVKNGYWLVDYVGIAGMRSPVGCAPDTTQQNFEGGCNCGN